MKAIIAVHVEKDDFQPKFTLIELLVTISIIAILAAFLLPALSAAKRKAIETECRQRQTQCFLGTSFYADDHNDILPPGSDWKARQFWHQAGAGDDEYDLRPYIEDYFPDLSVWNCANFPEAVPMTDSSNDESSNSDLCSNYAYFPRSYPLFGAEGMPVDRKRVTDSSSHPLLQDFFELRDDLTAKTCHGKAEERKQSDDNPSYCRINIASIGSLYGINIVFYDGHVKWHTRNEVLDCGDAGKWSSKQTYSVMPD